MTDNIFSDLTPEQAVMPNFGGMYDRMLKYDQLARDGQTFAGFKVSYQGKQTFFESYRGDIALSHISIETPDREVASTYYSLITTYDTLGDKGAFRKITSWFSINADGKSGTHYKSITTKDATFFNEPISTRDFSEDQDFSRLEDGLNHLEYSLQNFKSREQARNNRLVQYIGQILKLIPQFPNKT